jgi:hypothetical protein
MSTSSVVGVRDIRIEMQMAHVSVVVSPRDDIAVSARASNPGRAGDRNAAAGVRIEQVGTSLVVTGPRRLTVFGPGDTVDLHVEVPTGCDADVAVKYGSARLDGPLGVVRTTVDYGDTVLDTAERLEHRGGHGGIRVTEVARDADISLKSGTARVGRVGGSLRLTNTDGASVVGSVAGRAEIATSSGRVELGSAGGDVVMRSAYGGVHIRELVRGVTRIDGSYGAVHLGVRAGTAVWLDATSQHGAVHTDLAADTGPEEGEETLELHVRTGYGNISIHRSEAPPGA